MPRRAPADELAALRKHRNREAKDISIAGELGAITRELTRQRKAVGGLDSAWDELTPANIRSAARVIRITPGGLLVLGVSSSSAKYEVDVWLRTGGLDALKARSSKTLRGVRFEGGK